MVDTHCHVQYNKFDEDRNEVIKKALDNDVKMICVGTDYEMSQKAVELAEEYYRIWASVGLHPNDNLTESFDSERYFELAQNPKVVAIGEIGLDYYRTTGEQEQKTQKERFLNQLGLATRLEKLVIIHCRDAHKDMLEILAENPRIKGVIHSFTGTLEEAREYIKLGFYIGLNGIITFPPSRKASDGHGAQSYDEVVKNIPLDRILTETDAPFLTPVPYRGKRNDPSYVRFVVEKIAEIRNISYEEVHNKTEQNAIDLFDLKL